MSVLIAVWAALALVALVALTRHLKELDRRRQVQRTQQALARVTAGIVHFRLQMIDNFTPALRRAAASMREFDEALKRAQENGR